MSLRTFTTGFIGLCVAGLFASQLVVNLFGGDPTGLMRVAEPVAPTVENRIGRSITHAPGKGHDGYFFFHIADDPLLSDTEVLRTFDDPVHRASRVGFPLLAGGGGLVPASWIPWTLIVVNVIAMGAGTYFTARIAESMGASSAIGLFFVFNIGLLFAISVDGASVLASALLMAGLLGLIEQRQVRANLLFAASILTREFYAVFVIAALAFHHRRNTGKLLRSLFASIMPYIAVRAFFVMRFLDVPVAEAATGRNFGPPLVGLIDSVPSWTSTSSLERIAIALTLVSAVGLTVLVVAKPTLLAVTGFVAVPFLLVFTDDILTEAYDLSRVLAPTAILFPLALIASYRRDKQTASLNEPLR